MQNLLIASPQLNYQEQDLQNLALTDITRYIQELIYPKQPERRLNSDFEYMKTKNQKALSERQARELYGNLWLY